MTYLAAVVTISDGVFHHTRQDVSGDWLAAELGREFQVQWRQVVPDETDRIEECLRSLVITARLVVTTGGTGLGPRDVTPEAVRAVITREVPGMAEAMRVPLLGRAPHAMLSRQVVGSVRQTLVVALPGSPRAVREGWEAIRAAVPHALDLLAGHTEHRPAPEA